MSAPRHSPLWSEALRYRCGFCRKVMVRVAPTAFWFLAGLLGFRQYYCPHCFQVRVRPFGWLKVLLRPFRFIAGFIRRR